MSDHHSRYDGIAEGYSQFRPSYPASLLSALAEAIVAGHPQGGTVLDVGSGTGIFTRQLRGALPLNVPILGIEPSADMRAKAEDTGTVAGIGYIAGNAESLSVEDGAARAVLAATAAHWFPRPAFYAEARRVLTPGGILAIVEYVRDEERSGLARDLVAFMARHGSGKAYDRPDYPVELAALAGFTAYEYIGEPIIADLSIEQFIGYALSSSHARAVVAKLGSEATVAALRDLAERNGAREGRVTFGYLFQAFMVRRR